MNLSQRLNKIFDMAGMCDTVADIGSDHALLPLAMIMHKKCSRAIAADISDLALNKARRNIKKYHTDGIELRVGDGLSVLRPREAEIIVIAGMGGELISDILAAGAKVLSGSVLILSPNNAEGNVRMQLTTLGYAVYDEDIILENRRYYQIMAAKPGCMELTEDELEFGHINIERRNPIIASLVEKRMLDAQKMLATARSGKSCAAETAESRAAARIERYGRLKKWLLN